VAAIALKDTIVARRQRVTSPVIWRCRPTYGKQIDSSFIYILYWNDFWTYHVWNQSRLNQLILRA